LATVGPTNNQPLPPVEKPAEAPAQTNDVKSGAAQVQTGTDAGATAANGKKKPKAPKCNNSDESCSKEKKKKGLDKLNPF
jgi:outer membrane protein assembly factor BamD